ncbi:perlucin protein [Biomphalaria glabrata]|nr:perlucin protein [Biomphalaria glabrata]
MNFSYIGSQVMTINRMAIVTGSSSAVWQLKDPLYGTNIYLGGSDMSHEGYFTWLSIDTPINISDWFPGEPNDFTEAKGEDSMSWAVYVTEQIFLQLNDFNGTTVLGRPLCQKDALNVTYLIPLLETEMTSSKSAELQVTSGNTNQLPVSCRSDQLY